jgi:hypothetical protein
MNIPGFMHDPNSAGINIRQIAGALEVWGDEWSAMKLLPRPQKFKPLIA